MNKIFGTFLVALMLTVDISIARAGPYEDGSSAYERGDHATALRLLQPLADQGSAQAQYKLGRIYYNGGDVPQNYAEAAKWFRRAADQGNSTAQHFLGMMYEHGEGVPQNYAEAAKWVRKAANQGSIYAQQDIGLTYYNGAEGVPQNYAEAARYFRKAADQGYSVSFSYSILGKMYREGQGVPQNNILAYMWLSFSAMRSFSKFAEEKLQEITAAMTPAQIAEGKKLVREWKATTEGASDAFDRGDYATALKLYRPLAEQGDAPAQIRMGTMYVDGNGVAEDRKEAVKWFQRAAEQGNSEAQSFLGAVFHDGGNNITQDYKEAAKWYRLAADQGDADAKSTLGDIFYFGGSGVAQDYKESAKWYRLAAEQGVADAQMRLGYMYYNGQGITQDYQEARKWYTLAGEQGNAAGRFFLGNIYQDGKGVVQDYKEAVKWHRLAAQQGYARSQLSLGLRYYGGKEGVVQDYMYAYMWLSLAASKLDDVLGKAATASRNGVAKEMTPAQVLAAQEMAKLCERSNYKECDKPEGYQSATLVPMQKDGGIYVVSVLINETITLNFIVDSGASDVSIPADVVTTLMRTGTLKQSDFLGQKTYVLADGSKVPSQTFRIRSLKVGGKVVENVNGSIASEKGSLLLGQSFLGRFKSWSIDNNKHALVLE